MSEWSPDDPMCEYCGRTDVATYAHQADEVCAACLVWNFGIDEATIAAAPAQRPEGASYEDVWLLHPAPSP